MWWMVLEIVVPITGLLTATTTWNRWQNKWRFTVFGCLATCIIALPIRSHFATERFRTESEVKITAVRAEAAEARKVAESDSFARTKLEIQVAEYENLITEANAAALQAQLEVEKFKEPRTISSKNREKIINALKEFAGQHFSFTVFQNSEAKRFLYILNSILESAGWIRVPFQLEGLRINDIAGNTAGITLESGLFAAIGADNPEALHALAALKEALDNAGHHCLADPFAEQLRGKSPPVILIQVGEKRRG